MKHTKKEVEEAILVMAAKCELEDNYKILILTITLPKAVEMIVYKLFINQHHFYDMAIEEKQAYDVIYDYALELNTNGFVTFNHEPIKL